MRYTLKHRLVGAAVLAAIAVLLLPSFFKEKKEYEVNTKSQIPARPTMVAEEFKPPQPVPDIEPAPAPEAMFVPSETAADQYLADAGSVTSGSGVASSTAKNASSAKPVVSGAQTSAVSAMPLNHQGLPDAWVIQVGSFVTKEAANKLRDDLQADGQKAYVRTTTTDGNTISRVYIGPKLDRNQALAVKEEMDKRLKIKSMVMRFQP